MDLTTNNNNNKCLYFHMYDQFTVGTWSKKKKN